MAINNTNLAKRRQAKALLEAGYHNQKQIAEMLQVSEQTMCKWVKKHHWKEKRVEQFDSPLMLANFAGFVRERYPAAYKQLIAALTEFMLTVKGETP